MTPIEYAIRCERDLRDVETRIQRLCSGFEKALPILPEFSPLWPELPALAEQLEETKGNMEQLLRSCDFLRDFLRSRRRHLEEFEDSESLPWGGDDAGFSEIARSVSNLVTHAHTMQKAHDQLVEVFRTRFNITL